MHLLLKSKREKPSLEASRLPLQAVSSGEISPRSAPAGGTDEFKARDHVVAVFVVAGVITSYSPSHLESLKLLTAWLMKFDMLSWFSPAVQLLYYTGSGLKRNLISVPSGVTSSF